MNRKRGITSLCLLLSLALLAAACGGGAPEQQRVRGPSPTLSPREPTDLLGDVKARGKLRVSTDPAYPPQSFLNEQGEMEGFDVDVAKEIAQRLGVDVEWKTPSWDLITSGNWQGRWDVSVGSMTITPDREKVLDFTPPYYYTPAAVAVQKDNTEINDVATDLDGKAIGVCGGCTYESYLNKNLELPGEPVEFVIDDADVKSYDTDTSAIQDLAIGRLDAVISALPTLREAIDSGRPLKLVGDPLFYEPLAIAVDKNAPMDTTTFVDQLSEIVQEMHEDGTLSQLSNKWYGYDLTKKTT